MNATKMVGRQLRARKEVCYNQEALEFGQYSDEDDAPISFRRGGEIVTKKPFRKSKSPDQASSSDGSVKVVSDGATSDSKDEGSGSDSEDGSEDSYRGSRSKPKAQLVRRQPRRLAASRKVLNEQGSDSDSEASDKVDDGYKPDKQLKRQQRTGKRGAESSPARPARALRARKSAQLASMADPPSDIEEDSEASDTQDASDAEDEDEGESEGASDEEGASEEGSGEDEGLEDEDAKPKGRTQSAVGKSKEAQGSGRASRPVRSVRTKPAAKFTSAAAREESAPKRKPRINYAGICKVLDERQGADGQELFVIFSSQSYRKAQWIPAKPFRDMPKGQILFRSYWNGRLKGQDENMVNGILPEWLRVERIIATRRGQRGKQEFLTKWCGLPYTDATWESEEDLADDKEFIEAFEARETVPKKEKKRVPKDDELPQFLTGRALRDYQVTSLRWMMSNQMENRNCILGDEMGLGKTAQSIATLEFQRQLLGNRGPFLVIAPLTTLGHWNREIITWTGMNVVQYCGTGEDRKMIQEYEFGYSGSSSCQVKFDVLLTSYEILLKDKNVFLTFGNGGKWPRIETVIIDEAHRMKSIKSATRAILEKMDIRWLLLLTGTPVQNNMKEVFGIMNLLNPVRYGNEEDFYESFGGDAETPTVEQVRALQEELRPLLLRRMKEDVENLPEKEEVIVWVELTDLQRVYYKALYSQQIRSLLSGVTNKNLPNLRNLAMELRKVCCHPYLCNSLEDNIADRHREAGAAGSELERMIQSSGKMVLLHKLLPKLKAEGHKVLIFSQFKIMLDVIEDSLNMCGYPSERIDGSIAGRDRQAAIDRFTKGGDDTFVFLLSTKAGGQGITLTAADTVVIFDSDWNPQNDLQAMARCHRIGQAKDVTIYRLVCRDTYEQQVFNTASRKYGLDEAILGGMNSKNPEEDATRIADLLKHGAHAVMGQEEVKAREGEAFAAEDINEILAGRTEKRQIGSRAGNTFSTAHFAAGDAPGNGPDANGDSRNYWAALMPDAVAAYEEQKAAGPTPLGPRRRRAINYREGNTPAKPKIAMIAEEAGSDKEDFDPDGNHSSGDSDTNLDEGDRRGSKSRAGKRERATGFWTKTRVKELEEAIVTFGVDHFADIREYLGWGSDCSEEEVAEVVDALLALIDRAVELSDYWDSAKAEVKAYEDRISKLENLIERLDLETIRKFKLEPKVLVARQGLAAAEAALSAARQLITPDMPLPAVASKALEAEQTVLRLLKNGQKFHRMLEERRKLAGLLKGLAAHESWAQDYFDLMRGSRQGMNRLARWWSKDEDLGILAGSYKFGFWPHSARRTIELILNDPLLPTYDRLVFGNAEPVDDTTYLQNNLKDAPDLRNMLSWIHSPTYQPHRKREVVYEEVEWRKMVDALVQRLKALIKMLANLPVPGANVERPPAQAAQAVASREDPIAYSNEEEEDGIDDGSGSHSDGELQALKCTAMPISSADAGVQAASKPPAKLPSVAAIARTVQTPLSAATASAKAAQGAKVEDLQTSHAPASKAPRVPLPASAGKAAKVPLGLAQTPSKIGKENGLQNAKKVASSTKKRLHEVVDLTCSPSPARPAKQPSFHRPKPQASAVERKPTVGAHGKMKQAKLGFNNKRVGKSIQ